MKAFEKLKHALNRTPEGFTDISWKWTRRGIGAVATTAILAVSGITAERMLSDDYVTLSPDQKAELTTENQSTLDLFSSLAFDTAGHFEGKKGNTKSGTGDSLTVDLTLNSNTLTIKGEGQHTGITAVNKNPYEKPTEFSLTYELGDTAITEPTVALEEIAKLEKMPTKGNYTRTEKTYVYDREPSPRVYEESIRVKSSVAGEPEEIQRGKDAIFSGSEGAVDNAIAFYDSVQAEVEKFIP